MSLDELFTAAAATSQDWRLWPNGPAKRDAMFRDPVWLEHPKRKWNNCKCERCFWRRLTQLHHLCTADCTDLSRHRGCCEASIWNSAYYELRNDQLKGYCGECHRWLSTGEWLDIRTNRWIRIDPANSMFRPRKDMTAPFVELYDAFYQPKSSERRMSNKQARDIVAQHYNTLVEQTKLRKRK
jgi:hypothetical protein